MNKNKIETSSYMNVGNVVEEEVCIHHEYKRVVLLFCFVAVTQVAVECLGAETLRHRNITMSVNLIPFFFISAIHTATFFHLFSAFIFCRIRLCEWNKICAVWIGICGKVEQGHRDGLKKDEISPSTVRDVHLTCTFCSRGGFMWQEKSQRFELHLQKQLLTNHKLEKKVERNLLAVLASSLLCSSSVSNLFQPVGGGQVRFTSYIPAGFSLFFPSGFLTIVWITKRS